MPGAIGKWSDWIEIEAPDPADPYIHWSSHGPGEDKVRMPGDKKVGDGLVFRQFATPAKPKCPMLGGLDEPMAVPAQAVNPGLKPDRPVYHPPQESDLSPAEPGMETDIPKDAIIAGVIDVGIPLGHTRWRFADGKTRLLAAWQMAGRWDLKRQPKVPFGCEFYEAEINRLLETHGGGSLGGRLDEHGFALATGTLNLTTELRQIDVARRASHGAHVMDAVAGADPESDFAKRVRIIAVNAPSSAEFGASGTFLDAYMLHAIQRIVDIADGIWRKKRAKDPTSVPEGGYPIVINLSFGKQAGAKDEMDRFASELARFVCNRKAVQTRPGPHDCAWSRVDFVMPSGNDNQTRCNAFLEPSALAGPQDLPWRILPEDRSSNFAEFWVSEDWDPKSNIRIGVSPPGTNLSVPRPKCPPSATCYTELRRGDAPVARIYVQRVRQERFACRTKPVPGEFYEKTRYVLCVAPTYRLDGSASEAPAGLWTIRATNPQEAPKSCVCSVQTDQAETPSRSRNLRSYFDDPAYQRYDDFGRLMDSYSYPPDANGAVVNQDLLARDAKVRRHGTMNASAAQKTVARVGGFRGTDLRPAFYSATGRGRPNGQDDGTTVPGARGSRAAGAPTASLPTEDGYAHPGILASGSADGSVVAMSGTSFASSQGARVILDALLGGSRKSGKLILFRAGRDAEKTRWHPAKQSGLIELLEVIGGGRIPSPIPRWPPRF